MGTNRLYQVAALPLVRQMCTINKSQFRFKSTDLWQTGQTYKGRLDGIPSLRWPPSKGLIHLLMHRSCHHIGIPPICQGQCCSAMGLGHWTPVWRANVHTGLIALTQACCEPVHLGPAVRLFCTGALSSGDEQFCRALVTAYLYQGLIFIGACAFT